MLIPCKEFPTALKDAETKRKKAELEELKAGAPAPVLAPEPAAPTPAVVDEEEEDPEVEEPVEEDCLTLLEVLEVEGLT